MQLTTRDRTVIQYVARFHQLSSNHLFELVFGGLSRTPCDRSLRRLTDNNYLNRIERRIVGGSRGGSGQYVYQLGRRGFYMFNSGRYSPVRSVNYHALMIADTFVELRRLAKSGQLAVAGYSTEPDCWVTIGRTELKPDMYVDVQNTSGERLRAWLEIDMATESQRQLRGKLEAYWRAYNDADVVEWPVFPFVLWVAVDSEREKELAWLIEQLPAEQQQLFRVCMVPTLGRGFGVELSTGI